MLNQPTEATLLYQDLLQGLQTLLLDLRRHGFKVGVDQYLSAQQLFLTWQQQPELPPEQIRASLGALFCTSVDEQLRFPGLFQRWYDNLRPQQNPPEPEKPLKPTWFETVKSSKTAMLLIVVLVCLLGVALYQHFHHQAQLQEVKSGSGPTPPPPPPLTEAIATDNFIPKPKSPAEPIIVPEYYYTQYDAGFKTLLALPGLVWLGWLMLAVQKRFIALTKRRRKADENIRLENLPFNTEPHGLFPTAALKSVWHAWRRYQPFRSRRLHKAKTVRSTIQNHGYFQAVYRDRLLPPEYVLLIDRHHYHDFSAKLGNELKQRLQAEGLFVSQYYYDTDPHYCWPALANGRFFSLQQLADRNHGNHLIIIGEARSFYRASTGKTIPLGTGKAWTSKALLTSNTPDDWYESEHKLLDAGFHISPFTRRGIQQLLAYSKKDMPKQALEHAKTLDYRDVPLPSALRDSAYVWLLNRKPPKSRQQNTIAALKTYLGSEGYSLLAAVAAYPALDWQLTLALDGQLQLPGDEQREIRLRKLSQLPWFRHGNLPEVWRRAIILQLNQKQLNDLSGCFQALLNVKKPQQGLIELPVAIPDLSTVKPDQDEWLNTAKHGDPLQDMIFASVVRGRKPKLTEFALPYPLKDWFPSQYWRGLLLRSVLGLMLAGAVSFGAFALWQQSGQNLLDQQAEQSMRNELAGYSVIIVPIKLELQSHAETLQSQLNAWGFTAMINNDPALIAMDKQLDQSNTHFNQINIPNALPNKVITLAQQRLSYLTYNAPVTVNQKRDMAANTIEITLRQAYQAQSVYRDFINPNQQHRITQLQKPADNITVCAAIPGQSSEMVIIPAGSFAMGEPGNQHQVTISKPFAVSRCEVTFADYQQFTDATHRELPSDQGWGKGNRPVINVSWEDAIEYIQWLSTVTGRHYRLPTEAEWEYAARAKTTGDYYWEKDDAKKYAWFTENSNDQTHPVGEKAPNNFGLSDMSGNVWEWVQDCYAEDYKQAPSNGSAWHQEECLQGRVLRGGSWFNKLGGLRSAHRYRDNPGLRDDSLGFRLAQDLP